MVYHERAAWSGLIAGILGVIAYAVIIVPRAGIAGWERIDWLPPMLWTTGAAIVLSILLTIVWGIAVGIRDREAASASDIRDRDIARFGGRVEYVVLVIAGLGVIVLCAIGADVFWIANTTFAGFALSSIIGGIARVIAYRRGLA